MPVKPEAQNPDPRWEPSTSEVFFSPLRSIPFLLTRPKLLLLAILPVILNILLFTLLAYLGIRFVSIPLAESINTGLAWADRILEFLAKFSLIVVMLIATALLCFLLVLPISGPFHDLISEKIEREMLRNHPHLQAPSMPLMKGIRHAILEALRRVFLEAPILIGIIVIGFIPFLGPPVAMVLGFLNAMLLLPLDAYSYSMDRREWSLAQKREFLREHDRLWRPFGAGLAFLVLVPCNIIWFPPLAAVAATRMFCRQLMDDDRLGRIRSCPATPPEQT